MHEIRMVNPLLCIPAISCIFLSIEQIRNSTVSPIWVLTAQKIYKSDSKHVYTLIQLLLRKFSPKGHNHDTSYNHKARQKFKNKYVFLTLYKVFKNREEGFETNSFSHKHINGNYIYIMIQLLKIVPKGTNTDHQLIGNLEGFDQTPLVTNVTPHF